MLKLKKREKNQKEEKPIVSGVVKIVTRLESTVKRIVRNTNKKDTNPERPIEKNVGQAIQYIDFLKILGPECGTA